MRTKTRTCRYGFDETLRTREGMAAHLEASIEGSCVDAGRIAKALGEIARATGMARVARDAGLSRESLYKALSGERIPGFDTILKVVAALGLRFKIQPAEPMSPMTEPKVGAVHTSPSKGVTNKVRVSG